MNTTRPNETQTMAPVGISPALTFLLMTACGMIAANLYYAQPLIGPISRALSLSPQAAGLIVTMTQIGYAAGLLLIVPLGDLLENRRLVLTVLCLAIFALGAAAFSTQAAVFLGLALLIGLGSVAVQVLVPYAAHLAPEAVRGRVVGNIMSGLMLGIMLARPVASVIADAWSWRAVFGFSALLMAGLVVALRVAMPKRHPEPGLHYAALLASMGRIARDTPILQRRAVSHALMFGVFSLFWTIVPLQLTQVFHLSQTQIALFALAGVAGAIAAPIAGRLADRGWARPATGLAIIAVAVSLLLSRVGVTRSAFGLGVLVFSAILLDFAVTANLIFSQRAIFALNAQHRSRLNGLFMATFFIGSAVSSALAGWSYAQGGWSLSMWVGLVMPVLAMVIYLAEPKAELELGRR